MSSSIGITFLSYFIFSLALPAYLISPGLGGLITASLILVGALILMTSAARKVVSSKKILGFVVIQVPLVATLSTLFFLWGSTIHDASPFPFIAFGLIFCLFINLIIILILKFVERSSEKIP